jgi:Family of unknown function (DUF5723)
MRFFLIILFFVESSVAFAQNEGTLALMNSLPQQMDINPSFVPKYSFSFTLPATSFGAFYSNNGFAYRDLISKQADGATVADLPKLRAALSTKNYVTQSLSIDLLRVSFRVNDKLFMSVGAQGKAYSRLMLPKDALNILIDGNQSNSSTGSTNFSLSPQAESVSYLETYVGAAYKINDALTVGIRAKYLKGLTNVTTENSNLNLSTDNSTYAISATAAAEIRTSGIYNLSQSGYSFKVGDYLTNNGFGVDLGASYKITDKITVAASLLDIGSIQWKNNTYAYALDAAKAKYTFAGFDLTKLVNNEPNYVQSVTDSITNNFKFVESSIQSYSSAIPTKMYLNGTYQLREQLTLGAVLFGETFKGRLATGITLGANKHFGKWFSLSGSYTISNNSYNNLGAGFSLNLATVQLYLAGDNLLRAPFSGSEINGFVNSTQFFNIRTGLNFVFGWKPSKSSGAAKADDFKGKGQKKSVKSTNSRSSDFRRKKKR